MEDPELSFGYVISDILGNIQVKDCSNTVGYEDPSREKMCPGSKTSELIR